MINSQEIIERSVYQALLDVTKELGYTLDPQDYLPISNENKQRYDQDLAKIKKPIAVFGTGNSEAKGARISPRIVVNARGFYPGTVGLPKVLLEKQVGVGWTANQEPYETIDQYIDIHLVANNQEDMRLLHQILFWSIPQRGYIKPYNEENFLFSGNIFIELINFYDQPNNNVGMMEKVYEFLVLDTMVGERTNLPTDLVPIQDISVLIENYGYNLNEVSTEKP